ncbi:MAG TPA: hypothetical protein PLF85_11030, partial [Turneriella sp.]|nr:hypothetical protein [Turneriella sp.]
VGIVGKRIERLGSFQKAEIQPTIDFKKLDFVIVIQKKVETEALNFLPLKPDTVEEPKLAPAPPARKGEADAADDVKPKAKVDKAATGTKPATAQPDAEPAEETP